MKERRGLALSSKETRVRVGRSGGLSPHRVRGLAAASPEVRSRVAQLGGRTPKARH